MKDSSKKEVKLAIELAYLLDEQARLDQKQSELDARKERFGKAIAGTATDLEATLRAGERQKRVTDDAKGLRKHAEWFERDGRIVSVVK